MNNVNVNISYSIRLTQNLCCLFDIKLCAHIIRHEPWVQQPLYSMLVFNFLLAIGRLGIVCLIP